MVKVLTASVPLTLTFTVAAVETMMEDDSGITILLPATAPLPGVTAAPTTPAFTGEVKPVPLVMVTTLLAAVAESKPAPLIVMVKGPDEGKGQTRAVLDSPEQTPPLD